MPANDSNDTTRDASDEATDTTEGIGSEITDTVERVTDEVTDTVEEVSNQSTSATSDVASSVEGTSGNIASEELSVDVVDQNDELVVKANLSEFSREEIDVSISEQTLDILANGEGSAGSDAVEQSVSLPADVVTEDATAKYEGGVLSVTVPKAKHEGGSRSLDIS